MGLRLGYSSPSARRCGNLLLPILQLVCISLIDLPLFFLFTITTPGHVAFFTVVAFEVIYAIVSFMAFSAAITANCFYWNIFYVTIFIAFLTDHGLVSVLVHSFICCFSGDINVVRTFCSIGSGHLSSSISISWFDESSFDCFVNT